MTQEKFNQLIDDLTTYELLRLYENISYNELYLYDSKDDIYKLPNKVQEKYNQIYDNLRNEWREYFKDFNIK